jgi:cell division protein FtsL
MSWMPGWDSITGANLWSNIFFWSGIFALLFLGISEVVSHRYTERKDELASEQLAATERRHNEEMSRLRLETAKANERAAELERENLEIRQKVAGRRISKEQHDTIVRLLSPEPATFDMQVMEESEAGLFAADILKTLTDAGWTVDKKEFPLGVVWTNLNISLTDDPAAGRLAAAFQIAGVPFGIANERQARVTIIVGGKPSPF